jgi:hypothetical protein
VPKKKIVVRRRTATPPRVSGGGAGGAGAFTKPRSGGSRTALDDSADAGEKDRIAKILEERQQLAEIVASIFRGARQDRDVKQDRMGYILGRSSSAISNMEKVRTDFAVPDAVLWVRGIDTDPRYIEEIFERLLFEVRKFYKRRAP